MGRKVRRPEDVPLCYQCGKCRESAVTEVVVCREPHYVFQWTCTSCKTTFGPRWSAKKWPNTPGVRLVGLEPAPDAEATESIFSRTLAMLTRKTMGKDEMFYQIAKGVVSLILAGISIILQIKAYHVL